MNDREEDEMDLSDEEDRAPARKRSKMSDGRFQLLQFSTIAKQLFCVQMQRINVFDAKQPQNFYSRQIIDYLTLLYPLPAGKMNTLKDENDSLKCQLEAYKNEVDMNKQESTVEMDRKNKQITMLQQTLKGMQEVFT